MKAHQVSKMLMLLEFALLRADNIQTPMVVWYTMHQPFISDHKVDVRLSLMVTHE